MIEREAMTNEVARRLATAIVVRAVDDYKDALRSQIKINKKITKDFSEVGGVRLERTANQRDRNLNDIERLENWFHSAWCKALIENENGEAVISSDKIISGCKERIKEERKKHNERNKTG